VIVVVVANGPKDKICKLLQVTMQNLLTMERARRATALRFVAGIRETTLSQTRTLGCYWICWEILNRSMNAATRPPKY
jgi:hypothetical protein